jgi:catechol 2,3-dioxygenase-like lactoylglutathione lyase family enzyme
MSDAGDEMPPHTEAPPHTEPPRADAVVLDSTFPPASGPDTGPADARHAAQALVDHEAAEESARAADYELPVRSVPQPRPTDPPVGRHRDASPFDSSDDGHWTDGRRRDEPVKVSPRDDGQSHAMGIMLVVSNLARSVRFYRDLLSFTVVDSGANIAVLEHDGSRILLRQLADMSPVDRRVSHLHISVPDVDAAYKDLKTKGVEFAHRPRVITRGEKLDLWAATFRDPDGHDIALTQWRDRE